MRPIFLDWILLQCYFNATSMLLKYYYKCSYKCYYKCYFNASWMLFQCYYNYYLNATWILECYLNAT